MIRMTKVLLSADKSRSDLDELGIKPDTAVKAVKHVNGVVHESKNAELAAIDMLNSRLQERKHKISREILCFDTREEISLAKKANRRP